MHALRSVLRLMLLAIAIFPSSASAGEFKDCNDCPAMMKLPRGTFLMGSSALESIRFNDYWAKAQAQPLHEVRIEREFAISKYTVTRHEFAAFVRETGHEPIGCYVWVGENVTFTKNRSWRNPGFPQTDQDPVVCVSFEDARLYVQWLSRRTSAKYRLPTEAEWEYAARAGTTEIRFWGNEAERACEFANVADLTTAELLDWAKDDQTFNCRDGFAYTAPVGSFQPNGFGLHDMLGNVWQWVADCFHRGYDGAPSDGSAWKTDNCKQHVLRGGSWINSASDIRSAIRDAGPSEYRSFAIGFRVARAL